MAVALYLLLWLGAVAAFCSVVAERAGGNEGAALVDARRIVVSAP
jgi:hypothetical protein